MSKSTFKRYLLPALVERGTCPACAAVILWSPELLLWLDERQYGGAAPRGQTPQVPEHRDVCGKVRSPQEWVPPREPSADLIAAGIKANVERGNKAIIGEPVRLTPTALEEAEDALSEAVAQDAAARLDIAAGTVDAEEWL